MSLSNLNEQQDILMKCTFCRNIFMHFILSLCVSDLASALISWLFLYRRTWGFDIWNPVPDVFCKVSQLGWTCGNYLD